LSTSGSSTTATFTTSSLAVGSHPITASYSGDSNFQVSNGTFTQTVSRANSTTTLVSSANPSASGQNVLFTATVTGSGPANPSGTVIFSDGGTSIGQGSLSTSGSTTTASFTTSSLALASHTITASYRGDGT